MSGGGVQQVMVTAAGYVRRAVVVDRYIGIYRITYYMSKANIF